MCLALRSLSCDSAGIRLLCFCQRHSTGAQQALADNGAQAHLRKTPSAHPEQQEQQKAAVMSPPPVIDTTMPPGTASRALVYNHALRRGHRAPEKVAAALAKRKFVRPLPYLVTEGACSLDTLRRCMGHMAGWQRNWAPAGSGSGSACYCCMYCSCLNIDSAGF